MTELIDLGDCKQIVVSADLGQLCLSLWANKGSIGVCLTDDQAFAVASALIAGVRRNKRASNAAPIEARRG